MFIVSACLCGINCKYSGGNNLNHECLKMLREGKAIPVCPEQLGGLSTPREPAELLDKADKILNSCGKIVNKKGEDVTEQFVNGAYETLKIARSAGADKAILKESSPSCGYNYVYDGTFSGVKVKGKGVTAALLENEGIEVISEKDLEQSSNKLVMFNGYDREKAKKVKRFREEQATDLPVFEDGDIKYIDLRENFLDDENVPESVRKSAEHLMISIASDLLGIKKAEEISEVTGIDEKEVAEIISKEKNKK